MATQPLEQQVLHIFELIITTGFARKCVGKELVTIFLSVPFMDFEMLSNKFQVIILLQLYYNVINKMLYKYNVTFQFDVDRRYDYI